MARGAEAARDRRADGRACGAARGAPRAGGAARCVARPSTTRSASVRRAWRTARKAHDAGLVTSRRRSRTTCRWRPAVRSAAERARGGAHRRAPRRVSSRPRAIASAAELGRLEERTAKAVRELDAILRDSGVADDLGPAELETLAAAAAEEAERAEAAAREALGRSLASCRAGSTRATTDAEGARLRVVETGLIERLGGRGRGVRRRGDRAAAGRGDARAVRARPPAGHRAARRGDLRDDDRRALPARRHAARLLRAVRRGRGTPEQGRSGALSRHGRAALSRTAARLHREPRATRTAVCPC